MYKSVNEYLDQLKQELKGCDSALIQDALSDAEEHLRTALASAKKENPGISEEEALGPIIDKYGSPDEIVSAYKEIESRISPSLTSSVPQRDRSPLTKFLCIYGDSQAWAAALYLVFSVVTGSIFGLWTLFGAGLSLVTLILIIGLPLLGLYLLSLRGIALIEGRIVEALLGVRMPRKPIFIQRGLSLSKKLKVLFTESLTWKIFIYLITRFPLGFVYSIGLLTLIAFSIKFMTYPVLGPVFNRSLITLGGYKYYTSVYSYPVVSLAGFLLFTLVLHLAKLVGKIHGRYAKFMLVRKEPYNDR
jgi:uncharacterized membrane protein